jgi:hypothetical protein
MRLPATFFLFVIAIVQFLASEPVDVLVKGTDITVAETAVAEIDITDAEIEEILASDFETLNAQTKCKTTGAILA